MKFPHAQRAALGLMIPLMALLAPLSAWAAPAAEVDSAPVAALEIQSEARPEVTPAKAVLAWHRVGSPGTSRDISIG